MKPWMFLLAGQVADFGLTYFALNKYKDSASALEEANPIARFFIKRNKWGAILVQKSLVVPVLLLFRGRSSPESGTRSDIVIKTASVVTLAVVALNIFQIIRAETKKRTSEEIFKMLDEAIDEEFKN